MEEVPHAPYRPEEFSSCVKSASEYTQIIEGQTYGFHFYTKILAAIELINPTINILLIPNVIIRSALLEAVGTFSLPGGESTPVDVVAGGRAD